MSESAKKSTQLIKPFATIVVFMAKIVIYGSMIK